MTTTPSNGASTAATGAAGPNVSPANQGSVPSKGVAATTAPEVVQTRTEGPLSADYIEVGLTPYLDDGRALWELLAEVWLMGILVPKGSRTDGASIPFPISLAIPVVNFKTFPACVLHDYLIDVYRSEVLHEQRVTRTRTEIDALFHQALVVNRVNRVLAFVMWCGVRINAYIRGEK